MTPEQDGLTPVRADMVLDPNGNVIARLDGSTDAWPVSSDPQWRVYQKNVREYLVEEDRKEGKGETGIAGVTKQTEVALIERIEPQESPRGHQRFWQKAAQGAGVLLFAVGLGIGGVKLADSQGNQSTLTPAASPRGIQETLSQDFPSAQKEYSQRVIRPTPTPTPEVKSKEVKIQTIELSIDFTDSLGRQRIWFFDNARHGIPPNDPDRPTGTVEDYINTPLFSKPPTQYFQPKTSLYPEFTNGTSTTVGILGLAVDVSTGKGYMATGISLNNITYLRFELISDINNPTDYSDNARVMTKDGIGDIAMRSSYDDSFYMSQDSQGKYLNFVATSAIDPSQNGTYRIRLDQKGNLIPPAVKLAAVTPTPTPAEFKIWLPQLYKSVAGVWLTPVSEPVSPAGRQ